MAFIRNTHKTSDEKKIPVEDAFKFFEELPELYHDLAIVQYYCAGRISEIAGIQISNIEMNSDSLTIRESIVWSNQNKTFEYLKPFPKNGKSRHVHIHDELRKIIQRRLNASVDNCNYLFHTDGKPLNYCTIQSNFRKAQKLAGIPYTGTHILRHGMATLARSVGGYGLDSVIAMTGHKDLKLADHYSKVTADIQKKTSIKVLEHIGQLGYLDSDSPIKEAHSNILSFKDAKLKHG